MKIHFLGTGESIPSKQRQNTSLLFEFNNQVVLVDCSGTPLQSILKTESRLERLNDVVLTHAHVDHIYAVPSLLHGLWLSKGPQEERKIRLHGLQETLNTVDQLIDAFGLRIKPSSLLIENVYVDPRSTERLDIDCGDWILNSFYVRHGNIQAIGLYLDNSKWGQILFSADATVGDAIKNHLHLETKLLIHDCGGGLKGNTGHAGAEEINELIRDTSLEKVYLTHLPAFLSAEELQKIVESVSRNFKGKVIVPSDGDTIIC